MFNGDGVSVLQDEKVLKRDGGDGCTATSGLNATEHSKLVKMVDFWLCTLYTILKNCI